jgi:hypothetical protein
MNPKAQISITHSLEIVKAVTIMKMTEHYLVKLSQRKVCIADPTPFICLANHRCVGHRGTVEEEGFMSEEQKGSTKLSFK